jgi:hypothetical protein
MTGVFEYKKTPNFSIYHLARIRDATPCLHVLSPPIPALIPETGALEAYRLYLKPFMEIFS